MAVEEECLDALREAAESLGKSPTKAEYESLGLRPASGTIMRRLGGWNEAKAAANLETYGQNDGGRPNPDPKPDWIELPDGTEWEELSGHQRWYLKNKEYSRLRKERRRRELVRWVYEYKRDNCECESCGETHPGCLEFHHVDEEEKEFDVSRRANRGHSIENIKKEIDRCVVLCANCHRKHHYEVPERL